MPQDRAYRKVLSLKSLWRLKDNKLNTWKQKMLNWDKMIKQSIKNLKNY
jgi:hypothetical protein